MAAQTLLTTGNGVVLVQGQATLMEVVGSPAHHGSYAVHVIGQNGVWNAHVTKSGFNLSEAYVRWYMRFSSLPPADGNNARIASFGGASTEVCRFFVRNSGGNQQIAIQGFPWVQNGSYSYGFQTDKWYCFEYSFKNDASTGWHKVWLDGNLVIDLTGVNTSSVGNFASIIALGVHLSSGFNTELFLDCVVVADTYTGPETPEQTHTKAWTTDALFKKLGIPKTLSLDSAFQKQDIPKTFGVDSAFQKSFIVQKQLDALFKKLEILETFGVDVDFLKRDVIAGFAVDSLFGGLMTQTTSRQIDAIFKKLDLTKSFGLDTYFAVSEAGTYTVNFGLNVVFAYKVKLPELWIDQNGKLVLNIEQPYAWVGT